MYKKLLSVAAATAVLATSSVAFDAGTMGEIQSQDGVKGSYEGGFDVGNNNLKVSSNMKGDALIFPAFKQKLPTDTNESAVNWNTEMVFRNTTEEAIIAKVVIYAADDSRELKDFNVYLSKNDVFNFKIENGMITTKDASIPLIVNWPALDADTVHLTMNTKENREGLEAREANGELEVGTTANLLSSDGSYKIAELPVAEGYAIVYGMAQSTTENITGVSDGYHNQHDELFLDYRNLLDSCRSDWRTAFTNDPTTGNMYMNNGIITGLPTDVESPNIGVVTNCGLVTVTPINGNSSANNTTAYNAIGTQVDNKAANQKLISFGDVEAGALIGSVEISTDADNGINARNMLLPATALENFTVDNMLLWTEGEFAAIADRRIFVDVGVTKYNETGVLKDAEAFEISETYYTFKAKDANNTAATNTMIFTQPMKRILQDLANSNTYWNDKGQGACANNDGTNSYGGFISQAALYDNEEQGDTEKITNTKPITITSPFGKNVSIAQTEYYCNELQSIKDIEKSAQTNTAFQNQTTDGFAKVTFNTTDADKNTKLSAIVTQMTGTMVNGQPKINWVYSPIEK